MTVSREWVASIIRAHDAGKPRSMQVQVGPSELGEVCDRRLAYRALNLPAVNPRPEMLAAWVGTQAHAGMTEALGEYGVNWQAEVEVEIPGYRIPCHIDAWHEPSGTILDWKFVGETSLRKYSARMLPQYRTQVHLYGLGINATLGATVNTVGVVLIPRNGGLHKIHVWTEPYDEGVAEEALKRWHAITVITDLIGEDAVRAVPRDSRAWCEHCPWWNPATSEDKPGRDGCAGYDTRGSSPPAW